MVVISNRSGWLLELLTELINLGRGHIGSIHDAMIAKSSLDTIGLRTFGGGLRVLNMADQERTKNMHKCA